MNRAAEAELDLAGGQLVGDRPSVRQGPGQAVELGHHEGVAGPTGSKCLTESRSLAIGAGQAVVHVDAFGFDAESQETLALGSEVLLIGGASGVPDK